MDKKSTHKAEVFKLPAFEPIAGADRIALVRFYGFQVVVGKADWHEGDLAVYIQPDTQVPIDRAEFSFLKELPDSKYNINGRFFHRVKIRKLKKVISEGMVVPAPAGAKPGDDVWDLLELKRYEPKPHFQMHGKLKAGRPGVHPPGKGLKDYDVESFNRYGYALQAGEPIVVTEKIHGCSWRATFREGRFWVGSHHVWRAEDTVPKKWRWLMRWNWGKSLCFKLWEDLTTTGMWWKTFKKYPAIADYLQRNPNYTVFGEMYGDVQDMKYGCKDGETRLALFDIADQDGNFLDWKNFWGRAVQADLPVVPVLFEGPYDESKIRLLAEGPSQVVGTDHIREGCVVGPIEERKHPAAGRILFKIVGNGYYERK